MPRLFFIFICTLLFSLNARADGVDFKLGQEAAEFTYLTESSTFGYGGADVGMGIYWDEADNFFGSASILVSGASAGEVRALHFGVGAKIYLGKIDATPENLEGGALAIGGQVRYVFPSSTPFAILVEAFASPAVTSLSDFESLLEYRIAFELEVTPSARAYIGYRKFEIEVDNVSPELELDDEAHIGVRFSF